MLQFLVIHVTWAALSQSQAAVKNLSDYRTGEYDPFLKEPEGSCGELLFQGKLTKEPVQAGLKNGLKNDIPLQTLALGKGINIWGTISPHKH